MLGENIFLILTNVKDLIRLYKTLKSRHGLIILYSTFKFCAIKVKGTFIKNEKKYIEGRFFNSN